MGGDLTLTSGDGTDTLNIQEVAHTVSVDTAGGSDDITINMIGSSTNVTTEDGNHIWINDGKKLIYNRATPQ